jgi:hypothetical protein
MGVVGDVMVDDLTEAKTYRMDAFCSRYIYRFTMIPQEYIDTPELHYSDQNLSKCSEDLSDL